MKIKLSELLLDIFCHILCNSSNFLGAEESVEVIQAPLLRPLTSTSMSFPALALNIYINVSDQEWTNLFICRPRRNNQGGKDLCFLLSNLRTEVNLKRRKFSNRRTFFRQKLQKLAVFILRTFILENNFQRAKF